MRRRKGEAKGNMRDYVCGQLGSAWPPAPLLWGLLQSELPTAHWPSQHVVVFPQCNLCSQPGSPRYSNPSQSTSSPCRKPTNLVPLPQPTAALKQQFLVNTQGQELPFGYRGPEKGRGVVSVRQPSVTDVGPELRDIVSSSSASATMSPTRLKLTSYVGLGKS